MDVRMRFEVLALYRITHGLDRLIHASLPAHAACSFAVIAQACVSGVVN